VAPPGPGRLNMRLFSLGWGYGNAAWEMPSRVAIFCQGPGCWIGVGSTWNRASKKNVENLQIHVDCLISVCVCVNETFTVDI
jgi:hypothetical protein